MGKHSKDVREIVVAMKLSGASYREIQRATGKGKSFVSRWMAKHAAGESFASKGRGGRPSKLSPQSKRVITRLAKNKWDRSPRKVARVLRARHGVHIHESTVRRYVRSQPWGAVAFKRPVKPMLSAKNVQDRMACCTSWRDQGYTEDSARGRRLRNNILFTDESWIELSPAPTGRMRESGRKILLPYSQD